MLQSLRLCAQQRLFHRALPHVAALLVGLFLVASFGFGVSTNRGLWWGLPLIWLCLLSAMEPRLWRDIRFILPIAGRLPVRNVSLAACLGSALAWWLAGWQVGPALVALQVVLVGLLLRYFLSTGLRSDRRVKPEALRLMLLIGGALVLIHPYAGGQLVGAGDAEHYARQMADIVTQLRSGTFPVYVGQTLSAFEGSVHPLRTSPGFLYAGGLLDLLTGWTLTPVALLNLLIVLCLVVSVTGCYAALNQVLPNRRWECTWLALLLGTSPGILALVYAGDMYASWTALPWLPLLFLGWVTAWREPARHTGLCQQAVALAMLWLTHAPIALWSSVLTLLAELARWAANGFHRRTLLAQMGAAMLCLLLCHYVMVSVITLEVPANPYLGFDLAQGAVFQSVRDSWGGLLRMVSENGDNLAHDLHLSPGLLVVALIGLVTVGRTRGPGIVLSLTALVLMGLLVPWVGVTDRFWRAMPVFLMTVTEKWPVQRFYPLLSVLLPFLGALALTHPWLAKPRLRRGLLVILALSVGWSTWEARKFLGHGREVSRHSSDTARFLLPENNTLSRYSYEMWGYLPDFYSYGYMDPQMQNRLIDPLSGIVRRSNQRALLGAAEKGTQYRFVPSASGGQFEPAIILAPGASCFVKVDFLGRNPAGTLVVEGLRLARNYELPRSGGTRAFGSGQEQAQGFTLKNQGPDSEEVTIRFVPQTANSALPGSATVLPFDRAQLPFRLLRLMPYEVESTTDIGGWMETPKILIPGYRAMVNGQPAETARSPNGLLMVRIPAGTSHTKIEYRAPLPLAVSFWLNAAALISLPLVLTLAFGRAPFVRRRIPSAAKDRLLPALGRVGLGLATCLCLGWATVQAGADTPPGKPSGHYRLKVMFPVGKHEVYETLLSWRDPVGATSSIVVFYENDRYVRIGCRKDDVLKVLTDSLPASYFVPHEVEVLIGPQLRPEERKRLPPMSDEDWQRKLRTISVTFNGHPVWETDCTHQQGTGLAFAIGHEILPDAVGESTFRGRLIEGPRL